jgi:hypothetical protein
MAARPLDRRADAPLSRRRPSGIFQRRAETEYAHGRLLRQVCTDTATYGLDDAALKLVIKSQAVRVMPDLLCAPRPRQNTWLDPLLSTLLQSNKGQFPGPLPVLAYDFYIDPVQLAHVADLGALAVNLNVAALGDKTKMMVEETERMGMDALVQVHNEAELTIALDAGASIIAVVNRDMETFEVQNKMDGVTRLWFEPFEQTVFGRLLPLVPPRPQPIDDRPGKQR